jgi:hypothetical protein
MKRSNCPDNVGVWWDWLRVPEEARDPALSAHLAQCPRCRRDVAFLEEILGTVAGGPLEEPPVRAVQRAIALYRERRKGLLRAVGERARDLAEQVARLVWDSWKEPALAGVRGAGEGRDLVYQTADRDLRLHLVALPGGRRVEITGQLFSREPAGVRRSYRVEIRGPSGRVQRAVADAHGGFRLVMGAEGPVELRLEDGETILRIPELPVGAS